MFKLSNIKRHNTTKNSNHITDFPLVSECRWAKLSDLKSKLVREQNSLKAPSLRSVAATEESFRILQLLTNKKAFTDGPVVKDCIRTTFSVLFPSGSERRYNSSEIQTAIDNIQLSANTVSRICELLGEDLMHQLLSDLST